MNIRRDDITDPRVLRLLNEHRESMFDHSPPESVHALDIEGLRQFDVTFWTAWDGDDLLGCGALKEIDKRHGEVKSMRTAAAHLRKGVARCILDHMTSEALRRGYERLSLETGSADAFEPARRLYTAAGFEDCGPFEGYVEDPYSVFMTKRLE